MKNKLYVGNLSYSEDDNSVRELFSEAGTVNSATVIVDRETNRSKGFGFVEMSTEEEANQAIEALNGKEINGRELRVSIAKPREERPANRW